MENVLGRLGRYFFWYVLGWAVCCGFWYLVFDLEQTGLLILSIVYVASGVVISRIEVEVLKVKLKKSEAPRGEATDPP